MKTRQILLTTFLSLNIVFALSQNTNRDKKTNDSVNSRATEEYNNQLTSYFRVVADHITSGTSGYTFKMSLMSLKSIKDSAKWTIDTNFVNPKNRFLRYTEINAGVNMDKSQNITNINLGSVFTILNKRDSAIYVYRNKQSELNALSIMRIAKIKYYDDLIKSGKSEPEADNITNTAFNTINLEGGKSIGEIDKNYLKYLNAVTDSITKSKALSFLDYYTGWHKDFNLFAKSIQRKPLWIAYPAISYNYQYGAFSKLGAGSNLLVSLNKNPEKKPLELISTVSYYFQDDTATTKVSLEQSIGDFSLGVNKILLENEKGESQMELKFSGDYSYVFNTAKDRGKLTANAVFKYKLFQSVWLPLTVSYDPSKGNLFGFISVTINFMPSSK
ncbi:hypothetical protein [Asinibacterium sp. OR53]|uniref:hypothetical protein n=1 Tax=Asinibacterium sp. OR53 TaxID=925409 RepID=UPI00047EB4FA|nr:hypothetical protein [Asinibacterium sp. OR53]